MISVSVKGVLIGILLIALIVLVVFLIVMVSNLTDTIKKANAVLDGGMSAAESAKNKIDGVNDSIKEKKDKVKDVAQTGISAAQGVVGKFIK